MDGVASGFVGVATSCISVAVEVVSETLSSTLNSGVLADSHHVVPSPISTSSECWSDAGEGYTHRGLNASFGVVGAWICSSCLCWMGYPLG
jgi:hypothetical protein